MLRTSRTLAAPRCLASLLAAFAGGATVLVGAVSASGSEPGETVHVSVIAPAGKGCISSEKLQRAVQKRVSGAARKGSATRSTAAFVEIASADPGPGWVADVSIAGQAGRRSVRTHATSCSQLDEGLVLVVTLLADPDEEEEEEEDPPPNGDEPASPETEPQGGSSWGQDAPTQPKGKEEPEEEESRPGAGEPASPEDKRSPRPQATEKEARDKPSLDRDPAKKRLQFGLGAQAVYAAGLLPRPAAGVRGSFSWLSPTPVPLEASFTWYREYEEYTPLTDYQGLQRAEVMAFGVTACPATLSAGRLSFAACAGVTTTWYQHSFHGNMDQPEPEGGGAPTFLQGDYFMLSPTAELRFDVTLWSFLRIGAAVEAQAPVNRPDLVDALYSVGAQALNEPVIFQGRLGISLVLPP